MKLGIQNPLKSSPTMLLPYAYFLSLINIFSITLNQTQDIVQFMCYETLTQF